LKILKERDHSEDIGIDERIILEWILEKLGSQEGLFSMELVIIN
jgi:hypothetical protein